MEYHSQFLPVLNENNTAGFALKIRIEWYIDSYKLLTLYDNVLMMWQSN